MIRKHGGITIRVAVVTIVAAAVALTGGLLLTLQLYQGRELAQQATQQMLSQNAASASSALSMALNDVDAGVELLAGISWMAQRDARDDREREFSSLLRHNTEYYGAVVGFPDGSFHKLIHLNNPEIRAKAGALPKERWMRIEATAQPEGYVAHIGLLDDDLVLQRSRTRYGVLPSVTRPWWRDDAEALYRTRGHLIPEFGVAGRAHAMRIGHSDAIVAIQYSLDIHQQWLALQSVGEQGETYLYTADGTIVASDAKLPELPVRDLPAIAVSETERAYLDGLPVIWASNQQDYPPYDYTSFGRPRGYSVELLSAAAQMLGIELRFVNGMSWEDLLSEFSAGRIDILHALWRTPDREKMGRFSDTYYPARLSLLVRPGLDEVSDLRMLHGMRVAMPRGWALVALLEQHHPAITVVEVDSTAAALAALQDGRADAVLDDEAVLLHSREQFFSQGLIFQPNVDPGFDVSNGMHLLLQTRYQQLLPLMERAIGALQSEDIVAMDDNWTLEADTRLESGTVPVRGLLPGREVASEDLTTLVDYRGEPHFLYRSLVTPGEHPLYFGALIAQSTIDGPLLARLRSSFQWALVLFLLLLPLAWVFSLPIVRPIRALAIENDKIRRREYSNVKRVPSRVKEVDELSESMMAMVASIKAYEQAQRELMDAFIELIARAIDDKSPYTAAHCNRVPMLAMMLAEAAAASDSAAFASFKPETEDEWREFRIAAWLHDCGKITTPEHIVDKGSKLEVIYNRIHEIRTRFEILWRDAEIAYLQELHLNPDSETTLQANLEARRAALQADFEFVATCNVGGEFMDEDSISRLEQIATQTWTRHFDDRLGLSPVEAARVGQSKSTLPIQEQLIADKAEHLIERPKPAVYKAELGINMDIPEKLANQGELYNLRIGRGTLTAEDRFRINEHMISTIRMLDSLPFPDELARVPRWASTHHETMAGTGYPRRLKGDELSVPERVMAIADVFEALTAADRPYKPAKSLKQSLDIMSAMVRGGHLDPECFELFLSSGVYLRYAREYLHESQIDPVDVDELAWR